MNIQNQLQAINELIGFAATIEYESDKEDFQKALRRKIESAMDATETLSNIAMADDRANAMNQARQYQDSAKAEPIEDLS